MGDRITFECVNCGAQDRIDSTSLNFITSATALDRDEAKLCDACLDEELSDMYIDLSIGGGHTRSQQFEAQQEQRARSDEELAEAQAEPVKFEQVYTVDDPHDGEIDAIQLSGPSEAWTDIKELSTPYVRFTTDSDQGCKRIAARAVGDVKEHLEDYGWTVECGPDVKRLLE